MASINYGKPRRSNTEDSIAKLEESLEGDDCLQEGEERILEVGLDVSPGEEVR